MTKSTGKRSVTPDRKSEKEISMQVGKDIIKVSQEDFKKLMESEEVEVPQG